MPPLTDFNIVRDELIRYHGNASVVSIPISVKRIAKLAFCNCTALTEIFIHADVVYINYDTENLFKLCTSLRNINVDTNNRRYKDIDGNLYTRLGYDMIAYAVGKEDESFTVPNRVNTIYNSAFMGNKYLKKLNLPDSLTSIKTNAFNQCTALSDVTIPARVTWIGGGAFGGCISLTDINVRPDNVKYKSVDGNVYTKDMTELVAYAVGKQDEYFAIPDGVKIIGDSAFEGCTSLKNVHIPNTVTYINSNAFSGCTNLTRVNIPDSVSHIGETAFSDCGSLRAVAIPNGVSILRFDSFNNCKNLKYLLLPDSLTRIVYSFASNFNGVMFCSESARKILYIDANNSIDPHMNQLPAHKNKIYLDAISELPINFFRINRNLAQFYRLVTENISLSIDDIDEILEFTEDIECRAILLQYKRNQILK